MRGLGRLVLVCFLGCVTAASQESLSPDQVKGTWYGWLAGTGMEIKIATMPDGAVAYLKTVQGDAQPFLQELAPQIDGDELVLKSTQAPQPFTMRVHFEGAILFGVYDDGYRPYTIALARSMPDVEELFESPTVTPYQTPMQEARAEGRRAASTNNLRQIGAAFRTFAEASQGNVYPPMSATPGAVAPDAASIYPQYIHDPTLFIAPGHPDDDALRSLAEEDPLQAINDTSYWYLGYLVANEKAAEAFANVITTFAASANPVQWGDKVTANGIQMPRLRLGVERVLVQNPDNPAEAQAALARIPVMIERPGIQAGGGNVLFLDGHVEFVPYPGPFPMTQPFIEALMSLDQPESGETENAQNNPVNRGL